MKNNCERRVLEELGRSSFGSTYKARFKGDAVAIKEFIRRKWDETGEKNLKEAKILERLNQPNLVNFKNVCYQPRAIMFENISFSSSSFAIIRKISGLDGFLNGFLVIFRLKRWSYSFHDGLQFLLNNGIAHRDLKPANILVSYKHYANITDAAELNMANLKTT